MAKKINKKLLNLLFFLLIMGLTIYVMLKGNDIGAILGAISSMNVGYLFLALLAALFFVVAEGTMIWYLMHGRSGTNSILRCISYSFVGYFYSALTPSSTGGQPMQLYYMKRDGNSLSDSSVVLMTLAVFSRLVISLVGIFLLIFWYNPLVYYLQSYMALFYLGLFLNIATVIVLLAVMFIPEIIRKIIRSVERFLVAIHILKISQERHLKIESFIEGFQDAVVFLTKNKKKILFVFIFSFIQRSSLYILTYFVYRGLSLSGTPMVTVILLQAAIYVAVEMMPLPGAQGITELMYYTVFQTVFTNALLTPSLLITRGLDFYFLVIVSLIVVIVKSFLVKKTTMSIEVEKS
ncbi:lysylphosphatidylglycerol synthase transmembrane domain-containing protein [Acetobacterium woodii]|uniref:Phosphatidylglycerol lysyltransferase n=1 Tax=Acetobacterium woodii (strain ATCC 29683 / DSM 1030 / JCM 2381 / KCTC 1655 / WB1) TaxID=931626 RepID=H6LDW1_ACEWD|nr:lysylphosphatidylglycerol synthase transmembrane domain-containing protein [Acetobacterium woodii]AFA48004.1 putative lysylphosphatidylglycerol synthetase [Acetobacterium woodii DSM 1030]